MSDRAPSILIYGLDPTLLQTRGWVLERSGSLILRATQLVQFDRIPKQPPVRLLIIFNSLDRQSCLEAMALADARSPGCSSPLLGRMARQRRHSRALAL